MNWLCAQIGAREHYAIPRALRQIGRSVRLYTDFWAGPLAKTIASGLKLEVFRSLAARWHPELQENAEALKAGGEQKCKAEIVSWNLRALWWEILRKRKTESGKRKPDDEGRSGRGMEGKASGRHLSPDEVERGNQTAGEKEFQLLAFSL